MKRCQLGIVITLILYIALYFSNMVISINCYNYKHFHKHGMILKKLPQFILPKGIMIFLGCFNYSTSSSCAALQMTLVHFKGA